jgi:hypothetical protein
MLTSSIIKKVASKARVSLELYKEEVGGYSSMTGLCAYGAMKVFHMLNNAVVLNMADERFKPQLVVWLDDEDLSGHCYVEYGDYIVDITATQFGLDPSQLVTPIKERSKYEFWQKSNFSTDDAETFIDYLLDDSCWAVDQIPPLYF